MIKIGDKVLEVVKEGAEPKREAIIKHQGNVPKYNLGDRVKVVKAEIGPDQAAGFFADMSKWEGGIFTIAEVTPIWGVLAYTFAEDKVFRWDERCLKRVRKAPTQAIIPKDKPAPLPIVIAPVAEALRPVGVFFEGDTVEVIDADMAGELVLWGKYVISDVVQGEASIHVEGVKGGFYARRFKLISAAIITVPPNEKDVKKKPKIIREAGKYDEMFAEMNREIGEIDGEPNTCSYIIKYKEGSTESHVGDVCHARLGGVRGGREIAALHIRGHHDKMEENLRPLYRRWVEYIMGQGPRRDCFIYKGFDYTMKNGVLLNPEKPIEELAGAAVSLREGSEFKHRLKLFGELLDKGYSGNVAYLLGYAVEYNRGFKGFDDSHKSLHGYSEAQGFLKFFREGYSLTKDLPAYNKSRGLYHGISKWVSKRLDTDKGSINEFFRKGLGLPEEDPGWNPLPIRVTEENLFAFADKLETLVNKY